MAAMTATTWVQTVENRIILNKQKRNRIKLSVSGASDFTYPSSGGIPLPTTMGMVRNIDHVVPIQWAMGPSAALGVVWNYDVALHAIRGYQEVGATSTANASPTPLSELPTTWGPSDFGATGFAIYVEAVGW